MRRMHRVGLTGNIGSGKSTAALILAEFGARIIDADAIVHELLSPGSAVYFEVVAEFGDSIIGPDGRINRRALGGIVFGDSGKRASLNRIIHPAVRREILRRVDELEKTGYDGIVVVDAALMVETGLHELLDGLIVVTCPPETQVERIVRRDGLSVAEARARMSAQMPAAEKLKVADYEIDNSGSKDETRRQLQKVYNILLAGRPGTHEHGIP